MRNPVSLKKLEKLLKKPFFSVSDAKKLGVSASTLAYHVKAKSLIKVRRGLYRGVYAPELNSPWGDLLESAASISGGIICLTSALAIYQLTDEIPRAHWIAVANSTSASAKRPIKIVRMRNTTLGLITLKIDGVSLKIFNPERTIVDAFRYLSKEIAIKALKAGLLTKQHQPLDLERIQTYAKKLHVNIIPYLMAVTT